MAQCKSTFVFENSILQPYVTNVIKHQQIIKKKTCSVKLDLTCCTLFFSNITTSEMKM